MNANAAFSLALILATSNASAFVVSFDDADRGPSDTLQIGAVTVSSVGSRSNQPTTLSGTGLGLAGGVGSDDEIDAEFHFPAGSMHTDRQSFEDWLYLDVAGLINSVTFVPHCRIFDALGGEVADKVHFIAIAHTPDSPSVRVYNDIYPTNDDQAMTLNLDYDNPGNLTTTRVGFLVIGDSDGPGAWESYRSQHQSVEQTIQVGITIRSINYTSIPEPGAGALAAAGLLGICSAARRRRGGS